MKKDKELIYLEEQLRQLKSNAKSDPYTAREIEQLKKEIKELKHNKDGK
jgi:predicted RNase H-like nuclease (RuvC/YqgF family)